MSTIYTGVPANFLRTPTVSTSLPADGDPGNAASIGTPLQKLLDYVAWLQANAAGRGETNTFTQAQTFNAIASYLANIGLTGTALQSILKSGTGGLDVGTSIASDVRILLGNVAKWTAQASTGNLVSAGGTVTGLPAPVNTTDAATKAYVDGLPTRANTFTAAQTFNGAVNVPTPVDANDAASKGYVDGLPTRANTFTARQTFSAITVPAPSQETEASTALFVRQTVALLALSNWTGPVTSPVANLQDVAVGRPKYFGGSSWMGAWCAVGNAGGIVTTLDNARTWTARSSGTGNNLVAVSYGSDRYCAVGAAGTIVMSTAGEGATWVVRTSGTTANLESVSWSGTAGWAAVGSGGVIVRSPTADGAAWTVAPSGTTANLHGIAVNSIGMFCAVGDGGVVITSSDGVTWTPRSSGTTANILGVVYSFRHAKFFVTAGTTILSSPDGVAWTNLGPGNSYSKIVSNDVLLIGIGPGYWYASRDGSSWYSVLEQTRPVSVGATGMDSQEGMLVSVSGNQIHYSMGLAYF
jgi:hypothetical protein